MREQEKLERERGCASLQSPMNFCRLCISLKYIKLFDGDIILKRRPQAKTFTLKVFPSIST